MKMVCICSGGLDSTVMLASLLPEGGIEVLHFTYGSKHERRETEALERICKMWGVEMTSISLDFMGKHFKSALLQGGGDIPYGDYNEEDMKKTTVPFRNGIMLSIATGFAESRGCSVIALASHSGDHFIYPDCSPEFVDAINSAIFKGTDGKVSLVSPFLYCTKAGIVRKGYELKVPLEITYSCYKGGEIHCGVCATCIERRKAFQSACVKDYTRYIENIEI